MADFSGKFALTDSGILLDGNTFKAWSPCRRKWVKMPLGDKLYLTAKAVSDSEAECLMNNSSLLEEPPADYS